MRTLVLALSLFLAALSSSALADGKKHVTLHIINKTNYDFINGNAEHKQVNVNSVQSTVPKGQTGLVKFHFDEDTFSDVKMYVTYSLASDDGNTVEVKYHVTKSGFDCSMEAPANIATSHDDCSDPDVHYEFVSNPS